MNAIESLLKNYSVEAVSGGYNFHTISPCKKWYIPNENQVDFFNEYCDIVSSSIDEEDFFSNVSEIAGNTSPLIVNVKLKYSEHVSYNDAFPMAVCYYFQKYIEQHYEVTDKELIGIMLTNKNCFQQGSNFFITFSVHFPFFVVPIDKIRSIKTQVLKILESENVFNFLTKKPLNSNYEIFGLNVFDSTVFLYGSSEVNIVANQFYKAFPKLKSITDESELEDYNCFFPSDHSLCMKISDAFPAEFTEEKTFQFWLPVILSVNFYTRVSIEKEIQSEKINEFEKVEDDIDVKLFLDMLDMDKRIVDYHFIEIGKAIYNIYRGSDEGLFLWKSLAPEEANMFDFCQKYYGNFPSKNYNTIKTLAFFAREDSPEKYKEWHAKWVSDAMCKSLSNYDTDIAVVFKRLYYLDYAFICGKWYEFNNHTWNIHQHGPTKKITEDMCMRYQSFKMKYISMAKEDSDAVINIKMKQVEEVIKTLKSHGKKNSVIKEIQQFFCANRDDFAPMDTDLDIIGLPNGVLVSFENKCIFRHGKPEDYISKCAKVAYNKNLNRDHQSVKKLNKWLDELFPDYETKKLFLKLSASKLRGRNENKILEIWTGSGQNGKSTMIKLFEHTLGEEYCIKFPESVISGKQGNGPNPEVAQAKGSRIAYVQEPDADTPFKANTVKLLTGGDGFFARGLYSNGGNIEASFKTVVMCNDIPSLSAVDKASIQRVYIFPYISKWSVDAPESYEEQRETRTFKMIKDFENGLADMAKAFLWLLVEMYPVYKKEGIEKKPLWVEKYTMDYWGTSDPFAVWNHEKVITDKDCVMDRDVLFIGYSEWLTENYPGLKKPTKTQFVKRCEMSFGKMEPNYKWRGFRYEKDGIVKDV